jgi:hypothetical protein
MDSIWKPLKDMIDETYPKWICGTCGETYGTHAVGVATWHEGTCGICGRVTGVTEPRDYGHLREWPLPERERK